VKGTRHFNPLENYRFFHHWFSGVKRRNNGRTINSFPSIDLKKCMGILIMIPQIWKVRIKHTKVITVISFENFEYVRKKQECQYFYRNILLNYFEPPTK